MSDNDIDAMIINLIDRITRRMRSSGRTGRTVVLRLRFDDYSRVTRSHTMRRTTASTEEILTAARGLVAAAGPMIAERGLTLMGFSVSNVDTAGTEQLELPFDELRELLTGTDYATEVRADEEQARSLGISGVPFFVLGEKYAVSGAQPVELFEQALAQTWNELHGEAGAASTDSPKAQDAHDHGPSCEGDHCSV